MQTCNLLGVVEQIVGAPVDEPRRHGGRPLDAKDRQPRVPWGPLAAKKEEGKAR